MAEAEDRFTEEIERLSANDPELKVLNYECTGKKDN